MTIYSGTDVTEAYRIANAAEDRGEMVHISKVKMGRGAKAYTVFHVTKI